MTRALSLTCLSLLVVGLTGSVALAGKPTVAVLGIEVVGGDVTPADTQVAKELTEGLRSRAKAGTGPYQLAPGSDKELVDEKLLKGCDNEAAGCMAAIGGDLNAEWLIYGQIQKRNGAYRVDLNLLNIGRKAVEKTWPQEIPISDASGAKLQGWAKKAYAKLTGQATGGTLVIKVANADRGTVLIDGSEKGSIVNGTATVSLPPGKYKVELQSEGFKGWTKEGVTVGEDQQTTVQADLDKEAKTPIDTHEIKPDDHHDIGGTVSHTGGNSGMWKGVFYASVAVAAIGGGVWLYGYTQVDDAEKHECSGRHISDVGCMPTGDQAKYTSQGQRGEKLTYVGGLTVAAAGGFALFALYKGFVAKEETTERSSSLGHRVHRDRFVVTPIVSPQGGGATLRFDW